MSRVGKPLLMAFLTLVLVHYLTRSWFVAGWIALIPLALGLLNVLANVGYAVTAFSLIAAVGWTVMTPPMKSSAAALAQNVWADLSHSTDNTSHRTLQPKIHA